MDFTSPHAIKDLLARHGAKPLKTMGQNFLIDKRVLATIVDAADIQPSDTILEVGPGIGTLTHELCQKAKEVIAIEKDGKMADILQETLTDCTNLKIVHEDVLNYDFETADYKLVANLPYYITSPVIRKFLEAPHQPKHMVLMVQKEVAQRICAKPPHMSLLAVSVQFYADPRIVSPVSKHCFWPAPTVDSAIISIAPRAEKLPADPRNFFAVVRAGFSHPRKQLVNNLATFKSPDGVKLDKYAAAQWLARCGISENRRAQTLTLNEWISLSSAS